MKEELHKKKKKLKKKYICILEYNKWSNRIA